MDPNGTWLSHFFGSSRNAKTASFLLLTPFGVLATMIHQGKNLVLVALCALSSGVNVMNAQAGYPTAIPSTASSQQQAENGGFSPSFKIPFPIFLSTAMIQAEMGKRAFTNDGKFYPCPKESDCFKDVGELYLQSPQVSVSGHRLMLKAHMGGLVSGPLATHSGVSSEVTAYVVPVIENNVMRIDKLQLETTSSNFLFKLGAGRFRERATTEIETKGRYDLTPLMTSAKEKITSKLLVQWGQRCLDAALESLALRSLAVESSPDGVRATFEAMIGLLPPGGCTR